MRGRFSHFSTANLLALTFQHPNEFGVITRRRMPILREADNQVRPWLTLAARRSRYGYVSCADTGATIPHSR